VGKNTYVYGGEDWILYAFSVAGEEGLVYEEKTAVSGEDEEEPDLQGMGGFQYHYLNYLLETEEEEDKEEALNIISSYLTEGDTGNRTYLSLLFLRRLLSQGVLDTEYGMGRIRNNFPRIRMRAAELLALHGDLQTSEHLLRVLRYEYDPYAMAAEIGAIGGLKSDPDGRAGELIKRIIQNDSISSGNNMLADAALRTITAISNYHGTIDEHSIDTLFFIFKGNYSKDNRSRALAALQGVGK
jgi:HEAT repeat protein